MVGDELVHVGFNQLAVDYPGFLSQHVAGFGERRRVQKNIPRRTPLACVSGRLPVAEVWRLVAVFARFRFTDHWESRAGGREEVSNIGARTVFTNTNDGKSLIFVLLVKLRSDGRFVTPVWAPRRKVNNHHELLALHQRAQLDRLVVLEIVERPVFVVDGFFNEWRILVSVLGECRGRQRHQRD